MNKIAAVVVPTHPPYYHWAQLLEKTFHECNFHKQADLYFVFTVVIHKIQNTKFHLLKTEAQLAEYIYEYKEKRASK